MKKLYLIDSTKFRRFPISTALTTWQAVFPARQPDFETARLTPRDGTGKLDFYFCDRAGAARGWGQPYRGSDIFNQEENPMCVNLAAATTLATLVSVLLVSGVAGAQTTADEVVDDATLKAFVDGAAADIAAITNINEGAKLRNRLKAEGDWKAGSMFLIVFLRNGDPFIHGNDRSARKQEPARR